MKEYLKYVSGRFVLQIILIYSAFLCWGYLQEKITSTSYALGSPSIETVEKSSGWLFSSSGSVKSIEIPHSKWTFSCSLNLCMAFAGALTASILEFFSKDKPAVPFVKFWKAAITCAAASPIGYSSLQYINYPMMVLTKTMKPVPVLLVGIIGYGRIYPWYQYVAVLCLSGGLALYTFASDKGGSGQGKGTIEEISTMVTLSLAIPGVMTLTLELLKSIWGIVLVCVNLTLDGYTNNEQDMIFSEYKIRGLQMMKYTNIWQVIFISLYLVAGWVYYGVSSELSQSLSFIQASPQAQQDIGMFCLCASVGQILVFQIMEEHGSLVWITISITRKLFTILVSVLAFGHSLNVYQCIGISLVFSGIALELAMKSKPKAKTD